MFFSLFDFSPVFKDLTPGHLAKHTLTLGTLTEHILDLERLAYKEILEEGPALCLTAIREHNNTVL